MIHYNSRHFATVKISRQLSVQGVCSEKMLSEVITNSCLKEGPFARIY